jgi:hypothetical protein
VQTKGRYHQRIDETIIGEEGWSDRHWRNLVGAYSRAEHFSEVAPFVQGMYQAASAETHLTCVNRIFIAGIARLLGIRTAITQSTDYEARGVKTERLVSLCQAVGASEYISGPAAQAYIDPGEFARAGITLTYMDYSGYPEYPQPHPPFEHAVSVLDLLFCVGPSEAPNFMKALNARTQTPA